MDTKKIKRYAVLGILFFLPVGFLLMLYPSTHNYIPLEVVKNNVFEISSSEDTSLNNHITILAFFGNEPQQMTTAASNLKELIYDKFKGFKKFQIVALAPIGSEENYEEFNKEVSQFEDLKFWHTLYLDKEKIQAIFSSLRTDIQLNGNLATQSVFIIDMDKNQRGRLDDRTKKEIEENTPIYSLFSYDCVKVAELKNKMSDDMRILFTEYRQKRKGKFEDSQNRRQKDLINE